MLDHLIEPDLPSKKELWVDQRVEELLEQFNDEVGSFDLSRFGLDEDCIDFDLVQRRFLAQANAEWEEDQTNAAITAWENAQGWDGANGF